MYVILARQPRICTDVFENIVRVSILRKLVACCKTREFTNRLCYRSVVLDWFLAARTLLFCVLSLLYCLLIHLEYIVVNILVSSVTIVGYVLIPSPQDSWIWKSAAQTVNDKKYSAGPRYKIKS